MTLRWMQPAGSASVDTWNVYRDGQLALWGVLAQPDASGIYSTEAPTWPIEALYSITAVNEAGESDFSNTIALPEPSVLFGLCLLLPLLWLGGRWRQKTTRVILPRA